MKEGSRESEAEICRIDEKNDCFFFFFFGMW